MKMKKSIKFLAIILVMGILVITGCQKDPVVNPPVVSTGKLLVAEASAGDYDVKMYANDSLYMGFNYVYFKIKNTATNTDLTAATLTLKPMMDMGTMRHSAPFENPAAGLVDGYYKGAVVFIMPSSLGTWSLDVNVLESASSTVQTVTLSPKILTPSTPKMISFESKKDSAKIFVSLVEPDTAVSGVQDYEIAIHTKQSMMNFPAVTNYTVVITPEMPTMGHGSSNNVNPTHSINGHYSGKVNLSMGGLWRIHMHLEEGADTIANDVTLDINL